MSASRGIGAADATHGESFAWARELPRLLWLLALTIAAVYIVVFLVQLPGNIRDIAWNSDFASGFTVPETLASTGPGGHMVMGAAAEWVPLWFGLLTAKWPLHRELWGVMPALLFVATALIAGWSVAQVSDRRAALLAVLLALVASPLALAFLLAPVAHNTVFPCTALLGAYLIWLTRGAGRSRLVALAVPPLLGIVVGTCLGSDVLLAPSAVIPLGIAALLGAVRGERRSRIVALSAIVTIAVAVPVAKLTSAIMESSGYLKVPTPTQLAPLSELPARAQLLFRGLKAIFNGYLGPQKPGTLHAPLGIASDVLMSAALLALVVVGARTAFKLLARRPRPAGARKAAGPPTPAAGARTPDELARSLHVVYWVTSAVGVCVAFWLFAETGGGVTAHESYYGTVIFSVAAVIPLLLSYGTLARWLIPAAASVFFAASLAGLAANYLDTDPALAREAAQIARIAQETHVTNGYAGYWEASSMTWNTGGRMAVRPLMECPNPQGADICPFYLVAVPSWYVPRQERTFLLVDSSEAWVKSLPSGLGRPLASYAITPGTIRMYIYPYDIASRLGPAPS
jgi:hypothetical protein